MGEKCIDIEVEDESDRRGLTAEDGSVNTAYSHEINFSRHSKVHQDIV